MHSTLETDSQSMKQDLIDAQQHLIAARGEADQCKHRLLQLQQERDAAAATAAESRKADAAGFEVTIAEMKIELAALQEQGGERVNELSAALAAARQRAQDQVLQVRRLEAELRQATSQVESASQEHAADRGLLQEELRRVTAHASQLKDQVAALKAEYERSVGSLQNSLSEMTMRNSKLEADARSPSSKSLKMPGLEAQGEVQLSLGQSVSSAQSHSSRSGEETSALLQQQMEQFALQYSELEAASQSTLQELIKAQQQLSSTQIELDQVKSRLIELQQQCDAAGSMASSQRAVQLFVEAPTYGAPPPPPVSYDPFAEFRTGKRTKP